jgi:2-oxoisovalerate dehydrogenase E2 component (dihydrolipoyl transacylase)
MPQLGESVTEGTVDKWLKHEGDHVQRDEPLVEVVTDKVNAEIPSPFEGTLVRISVVEGATVAIGAEIAQMEVEGLTQSSSSEPVVASASPAAAQRQRFSPAVRRLAEEHGIDPSGVAGTGEGGRVTRDDVLAHLEARDAAGAARPAAGGAPAEPTGAAAEPAAAEGGDEQLVRLSAMRRSIAEHMTRSLATSPHAWTMQEVDVTELVRYREAEKEGFQQRHGVSLTYLPFVIQVVCDALREFPYLNSTWTADGILLKRHINVGLAVAIPDGLIVPVIKEADHLGFTDLARAVNDLAQRARSKQLRPEDVQGGTFTVNNTGATGSVASQPIINQPQAAIITTESILKRPVVIGEGIAVRHVMNMCLSFDHRIVDGMMSGQFLGFIRRRLEAWSPASIRI